MVDRRAIGVVRSRLHTPGIGGQATRAQAPALPRGDHGDLFAVVDVDTRTIADIDPRFADLLGYDRDDLLGQPVSLIVEPSAAEQQASAQRRRHLEETGESNGVARLQRKDGKTVVVDFRGARVGHCEVFLCRIHRDSIHLSAEAVIDACLTAMNAQCEAITASADDLTRHVRRGRLVAAPPPPRSSPPYNDESARRSA